MSHHRFRDEGGIWWEAWDVWPTSVERRERERRAHAGLEIFRPLPLGDAERRRGSDRRRQARPRAPVSAAFASGWVVFQSPSERRRLAPVPAGWEQAGEAELRLLCRQATPTGKLRRLIE